VSDAQAEDSPLVLRAPLERNSHVGGNRHQSTLRLCRAVPNSLAFVVSQDGDLTVFDSTEDEVGMLVFEAELAHLPRSLVSAIWEAVDSGAGVGNLVNISVRPRNEKRSDNRGKVNHQTEPREAKPHDHNVLSTVRR
jgi:hypothetical protein